VSWPGVLAPSSQRGLLRQLIAAAAHCRGSSNESCSRRTACKTHNCKTCARLFTTAVVTGRASPSAHERIPSRSFCESITPCSTQDPAGAAALDIEHVDSGDDVPRIEMDLACGVLDLQVRRCGYPQLRLVFADMLDLRWCPDAGQRP